MAEVKKTFSFDSARLAARKDMLKAKFKDKKQVCISTGFQSLDKVLGGGLVDNLYILGAESSVGKTALMTAIAKNAAKAGVNVLYFALEMTQAELYARGVSALSFCTDKKVEYRDIVQGKADWSNVDALNARYFEIYDKLYIIDEEDSYNDGGFTAEDIYNIAIDFASKVPDERVMVVVDYLQYLKPAKSNMTEKQAADDAVSALKSLSSRMPVLVASSIARCAYSKDVQKSSFKESGSIEYTGGYLIGYKWEGFTDTASTEERQKTLTRCMKDGFRKITLDILKARNGAICTGDAGAHLKYYPAYDVFEDDNSTATKTSFNENDNDDNMIVY